MQLWMTTVAGARGAARTAQEIEAAGWDGMLVVDSQNLSGDPYVALAMAATGNDQARSGHRRHQLGDAPCRGDGDRHHQRQPRLERPRRAGHRPRRFGLGPSRPRAGAAAAVRALPAATPDVPQGRGRELRRHRHPARRGAADVGAAPARRAAREPHRLDRRRRQGAGRGRGQRPQGDRHRGPARRPRDVRPRRRRRAPEMGHRACEEDAPGGGPRSQRHHLRRLPQSRLPHRHGRRAQPGARRAHDLRALLGDARQDRGADLGGRPRRCSRRCTATTT